MNSLLVCNVRVYRPGIPLYQRPRAFEIRNGRFLRFFDEPFPKVDIERINLNESFIYPGFFDSHTHFVWGGSAIGPLNFAGVTTVMEVGQSILSVVEQMRRDPGRGWIVGLGLDQSQVDIGIEDLDDWCAGYPTIIETKDLHSAVANRAALEIAGYWNNVSDPEGGRIERNADGIPTGWLREFAVHAVKSSIPEATSIEQRRWFEQAAQHALSLGVIGVGENANSSLASEYIRWSEADALPLRVDLWLNEGWPNERTLGFQKWKSERLRIATQKLFLDGSLGSRTAWFREPYTSNPETHGFPMHSDEEVISALRSCINEGWEAAVHTIGDASCEQLLHACEVLQNEGLRTDGICAEHLQVMTSDTPQRMANLELTASMQPIHLAGDRKWMVDRIGNERCKRAFAFRTLLENGINLRFGSDWPVESLNPIPGLRTAILRTGYSNDLGDAWFPNETIDFDEALTAFTKTPHHRAGWRDAGLLQPDAHADFLVLDTDLSSTDPRDWKDNPVLMTWMGGAVQSVKS